MIKNIVIVLINVLVILFTAFGTVNLQRSAKIYVENFSIGSYPYSISLSPQEEQNTYYRISPYDDTLVFQGEKYEKVASWEFDLTNEKETDSIKGNIKSFLDSFKNNREISFAINGKYSYIMEANIEENVIQIQKSIRPITDELLYFDNLINFNEDDIIFDDQGDAYVGDTEFVITLGLRSRFIQTSIVDVDAGNNIYIYNPKSKNLIKVVKADNTLIRIDREYGYVVIRESPQVVGSMINSQTTLEVVPAHTKLIL